MISPNFLPPEIKKSLQKQNSDHKFFRVLVWSAIPNLNWPTLNLPQARARRRVGDQIWLALLFVAIFVVGIFGYPAADAAYRVYKLYPIVKQVKSSALAYEFNSLYIQAQSAHYHLQRLNKDSRTLARLRFIPGLGPKLQQINNTAAGAEMALHAFLPSLEVLSNMDGKVHEIPATERREVIAHIAQNSDELKAASNLLKKGSLPLAPHQVRAALAAIDQAASLSRDLPEILGVNEPARYLVVFANNLEIRPAGGFIGSYGLLTVKDGEIADFQVRDSYELPGARNVNLGPPAPPVAQRFLAINGFPFRDSNWDPDHQAAAQSIKAAYAREGGEYGGEIKGVITVTTEVLKETMALTGPVKVNELVFSEDNVVQELEKQVEITFYEQNISWFRRKDIVGDLARELRQRVEGFTFEQNMALLEMFGDLADRKHIAFSFDNAKLQESVSDSGWDGRLLPYSGDTLMVVDANLMGHKTEPAMVKKYSYGVSEDGGKLYGNLTIHYRHRGQLNPLVHNYRTYVRVYAPNGSKLVGSRGTDGTIDTMSEFNRTVFGTLLTVPIAQEKKITFTYELPSNVAADKNYSLQVLKQIGSYPIDLQLSFDFANVKREIRETFDTDKLYKLN